MQKFFAALREPVAIDIPKTVLPDRVNTGYDKLDDMLLGGIPKNHAVILSSSSCEEKDFLVRRFLEVGTEGGETTLYITTNPGTTKSLVEKHRSNFYLLLCNPQADIIVESLPNIYKCNGIENLNEMNIALAKFFQQLSEKIFARDFNPPALFRGPVASPKLPVINESPKVVQTQYIKQLRVVFNSVQPPRVPCFLQNVPVVNGIAPHLTLRTEHIRRDPRYKTWSSFFCQLENFRMAPYIRTVVRDINRDVPDYFYVALSAVFL